MEKEQLSSYEFRLRLYDIGSLDAVAVGFDNESSIFLHQRILEPSLTAYDKVAQAYINQSLKPFTEIDFTKDEAPFVVRAIWNLIFVHTSGYEGGVQVPLVTYRSAISSMRSIGITDPVGRCVQYGKPVMIPNAHCKPSDPSVTAFFFSKNYQQNPT